MRKSGILMHITSLPGPYGIGSMGKSAFDFVDFLAEAGQSYWQILPLSPTGYGDSPYQAFSTFAGNHYLIDLDILIWEGLLTQEEVDSICWEKDVSGVVRCRKRKLAGRLRAIYGLKRSLAPEVPAKLVLKPDDAPAGNSRILPPEL